MLKIAINGYGRIGRSFVRAFAEREAAGERPPFTLVAINDLGRAEDLLYLTRYDTAHGRLDAPVTLEDGRLRIGGQNPRLFSQARPEDLPWGELGVDLVLECSGHFRAHGDASRHLNAGAGRVIIGAVPFDRADQTIVYGVNHRDLKADSRVLSAASCTTHCVAPVLAALDREFGVRQALMKEIHAYTSDQTLLDHVHRDPRRGRAGAQNIIPTTSSAIKAVQAVLPALAGRVDGHSIRVPTLNVAMVALTLLLERTPAAGDLNPWLRRLSQEQPELIGYNDEPLVSVDFNHRPESAVLDATQTRVQGELVQVVAWYDNEWGYANRLIDWVAAMASDTGKTATN
ncbi:type I glyceraldehyde-3-phosphate dehydrogenase [Alloalcanivorax gelatiniphagus]|uniref:Erythrose-4-phosphate dehydrogenase n=1 Tax=Alloalcanivorax gelatiniphagus TaxID=1194167 RepID=A0ABY2XH33_9GAMM|nr:glyceraldehyde 3-phosphate dehydrogenase NAD-binding domain-containing protein [Alloalcanivorax gelatiniphagus]TMW10998.1 erythrose-4-phosphate dehydrogenase [Alloalcanivorax gelatiniphagus]|tara:strand:- start:1439 stop:2470 length:1032 start_codon:yes stop_codon:yes gene_type:complete